MLVGLPKDNHKEGEMLPAFTGSAAPARGVASASRALGLLPLVVAFAACSDTDGPLAARMGKPPTQALPAVAYAMGDTVPDEFIVVLKPGTDEVRGLATSLVDDAKGRLKFSYTTAVRGFSARIPSQALEGLKHNPRVESVYPNRIVSVDDVQASLTSWGLDRIDQSALPLDGRYSYALNGAGVNAYIIDTGIRSTHQEFGGRVIPAFSAVADGFGAEDCHGHGTHVAGTIGGSSVGVAKGVSLYAVRVLACNGGGMEDAVLAGIDWVAANRVLPAVANMSLSGGLSPLLDQAVANLTQAGVVLAVAAGNNAADACFFSPAAAPTAITVGATDQSDHQASYSNFGSCLDMYAPGSSITSAWATSDTTYRTASGTSMAAPHVAGAAALFLQAHPQASPSDVASALTGSATRRAVSGVGKASPNLLLYTGAFGQVAPAPTPPPPLLDQPPIAVFSSNCARGKCTFDPSTSSDDHGVTGYRWDFGDGQTLSAASAGRLSHVYSVAGTYTVILVVTDAVGQSGRTSQQVKVRKN
jgi:subtilisin family serine protease